MATAASDVGRVRSANEDTIGSFPELCLFVVADGMGGLANGKIASQLAVDVVRRHVEGGCVGISGADDGTVLTHAIARANDEIMHEGASRSTALRRSRLGATIVALRVSVESERACWAHVGDSRLYLLRDGCLRLLTADHTAPGVEYRNRAIVPLDLPHTSVLIQALGVSEQVEPALGSAEILANDLFLLCTDGVSALVPPDVLMENLARDEPLTAKAKRLIQAALDVSGRDNASVVLVRILGD